MSLAGRGVLVTRPADVASALASLIEKAGGRAVIFPAIEIVDLPPPSAFQHLADFRLAVFVSPSAVLRALRAKPAWPRDMPVAAIGEGTRRVLKEHGFRHIVSPTQGADSEALLAMPELAHFAGERVLIVRGAGGRELLAQTLAARGARVEAAECYRRERPQRDARALLASWKRGEIDAVTVFSSEALNNLAAILGEARLQAVPVFVSHARIAEHAQRCGMTAFVAGASDDEMVRRLVAYFHERH